jgi:hypothetical protein
VAGKEQKTSFARAYGASAVDMEAAAVAQGARARGIEFGALKVISDTADFNLQEIDRFVASDGRFQSAKFAGYVALRPWLWKTTIVLARNSAKASRALSGALADFLESISESSRPEFDSNERTLKFASAHTSVGHVPDIQRKP